jgi:hypothetical protein
MVFIEAHTSASSAPGPGTLLGKYIDSNYTKLSSYVFLGRAAKRIEAFAYGNIAKADSA